MSVPEKSRKQKQILEWEESKEKYDETLEDIKAEFQSQGLLSLRSNPIYYSKVIIGSKHTFQCSKDACDFFARIIENFTPNPVPKVKIASKIKRNSYEWYDRFFL